MLGESYDVAIIGAGVIGSAIARRLSAYKLDIVILEKESDVSFGVSKANSGIVHAGFHHPTTSLKAQLENRGNRMFDQLQKELHFAFRRCGILVAAMSVEEMNTVEQLYAQGVENSVIGIELAGRERMLALEPKLNPDIVGGLHAPSGGIIEPYRFVFALVESAIRNGVSLRTDFEVVRVERHLRHYHVHAPDASVKAKWVINAAGLHADSVSRLFDAEEFDIVPRKGEEYLMDRNAKARPTRVIFPVPSAVSKGMLVIPTVEGTMMIGPTAAETDAKTDVATSGENFEKVFYSARRLMPDVSERDIITAFAGLRPTLADNDFFIALSKIQPRFVQVAGIQSPGLTAAPAIAEYVKDLLKKGGLSLAEDPDYDPFIDEVPRLREKTPEEADLLIASNPDYGEIVCRCESVSKAEIIQAIRHGHVTLDGVKFYTRAQMGRCQGGFCTFKILQIISEETGMPISAVTKRGAGSNLLIGPIGDVSLQEHGDA